MLAASAAPGLIDVYEANGETAPVPGNPHEALVLVHVGQEPADAVSPEMLHPPLR